MIDQLFCANHALNSEAMGAIYEQQSLLTQTDGALGRIEEIIVRLAAHQGVSTPEIKHPWMAIFAADHGIVEEGVSDYSAEMTSQWLDKLCRGHSASNVLSTYNQATLELINIGMTGNVPECQHLLDAHIASGTANFTKQPAMTTAQLVQAIGVGMKAAERAKEAGADVFIGGELGVANTTSALAMIAVLSGKPPIELISMGRQRVMRRHREKAALIEQAITLHREQLYSPLNILQHLGGFETAALCGAYIRSAQLGMSIIVDGLMATVAAWIADLVSRNDQLVDCDSVDAMMELGRHSVPETMFCICGTCPRLVEWCFFSHQSAEAVHGLVLDILAVEPMLQFDMRYGQATGAAFVIPLLQQACAIHKGRSD